MFNVAWSRNASTMRKDFLQVFSASLSALLGLSGHGILAMGLLAVDRCLLRRGADLGFWSECIGEWRSTKQTMRPNI